MNEKCTQSVVLVIDNKYTDYITGESKLKEC